MVDKASNGLHIYCVCGQKMRVRPAMYGQPGKCVACSLKIRVPSLDELPPDTDSIHLKDYPQFLRKPARPQDEAPEDAAQDVALGDELEPADIAPLDVYEPIAVLCSYEFKVAQTLEQYRDAVPGTDRAKERTRLMGYRALARKARGQVEEQLRQQLMQVAAELTAVKEQIARAGLSARVGEFDFWTYMESVAPLRLRREALERLRHNLRGWLAVTDPYIAGGYHEVSLEDPPVVSQNVPLPDAEFSPDRPLFPQLLEEFRRGFSLREDAEARLAEWERMQSESGALEGLRFRAQATASLEQARAAISFYRERLMQALGDRDHETRTIKAHLELARERLLTGALDRSRFSQIEMDLLRAQNDAIRARDVARRAVSATNLTEVPAPESTLFRRMQRKPGRGAGPDAWFAWGAALVLVLSIFRPIVHPDAGGNVVALEGFVVGMAVVAILLALFAAVPGARIRGTGLAIVWLAACVAATLYLHDKYYSLERVGEVMRQDARWFLREGMLGLMVAALLSAAAYFLALLGDHRLRWVPVAVLGAGLVIVGAVATDLGGALYPRPVIDELVPVPVTRDGEAPIDSYRVLVTMGNEGQRSCWVAGEPSAKPFPVFVEVRGQSGESTYPRPARMRLGEGPWRAPATGAAEMRLGPGERATWEYVLQPGDYSLALRPAWSAKAVVEMFTLGATRPAPPPEAAASATRPAAGPGITPAPPDQENEGEFEGMSESEGEAVDPAVLAPPPVMLVRLRGVGGDSAAKLRFVLSLTAPDGQQEDRRAGLGDPVYRDWHALEYDPARDTLTLGVPTETGIPRFVRILRTGETVEIPLNSGDEAP
jgi:hypothetical protein